MGNSAVSRSDRWRSGGALELGYMCSGVASAFCLLIKCSPRRVRPAGA